MLIMGDVDSTWAIHQTMLENLRRTIRNHQLALMAEPDPGNPWWFLVDPAGWMDTPSWD